jgi:hypothetical protein
LAFAKKTIRLKIVDVFYSVAKALITAKIRNIERSGVILPLEKFNYLSEKIEGRKFEFHGIKIFIPKNSKFNLYELKEILSNGDF